jgi:protein TonB
MPKPEPEAVGPVKQPKPAKIESPKPKPKPEKTTGTGKRAQPQKVVPRKGKTDKKDAAPEAPQAKTGGEAGGQPQTQGAANGKKGGEAGDGTGSGSVSSTGPDSGAHAGKPGAAPAIIDVSALKVSKKVSPDYPMISRKRQDQGRVVLLAEISSGAVVSVRVERGSGHAPLDESAIRALKKWRFEMPANEDRITARIPFVFELK